MKNEVKRLRGEGLTYPEIANIFGVTPGRIGQIVRDEIGGGCGRDRVRELVRVRDGHTCQICFKKWESGQTRFDVHHLDLEEEGRSHDKNAPNRDRKNMSRLITLCRKCHIGLPSVRQKMRGKRTKKRTRREAPPLPA
jgi:5-methylcytosine-specific restriction endonuclease McrA